MVTAVNQEVNVCLLKLCLALLHKHCFFGRHIQTELSYPFKKKNISVFIPPCFQRCIIYICVFLFLSFKALCGNLRRVIGRSATMVHLCAILSIACLREISAVFTFHAPQVRLTQIQSQIKLQPTNTQSNATILDS